MRQSQYERMIQELKETRQEIEVLTDHFGRLLSCTENLCERIESLEFRHRTFFEVFDDFDDKMAKAFLFGALACAGAGLLLGVFL